MQGKEIGGRACTSIRLFALCQAMDWNHLPVAGGIYDQHPKMMDDFMYIFKKKAEREELDRKLEKRKAEQQKMNKMRHSK